MWSGRWRRNCGGGPHGECGYSEYETSLSGANFGATVLGFVNADGVGQYGVEGAMNELLTGKRRAAEDGEGCK